MTDKELEASERTAWQPKTSREEAKVLNAAPLATLSASEESVQAAALVSRLAQRHRRPSTAKGKSYGREKTLMKHVAAVAAFVADLLDAAGNERSEGWLRCSLRKSDYSGQVVTWRMFDAARQAFTEAGLVEHKQGYPGFYQIDNPGPMQGKLTRYRATPALLSECEAHGVTPVTVREHFQFVDVMPAELVQLTSPDRKTPDTDTVQRLRAQVAELNSFFARHTLTHPTIKHVGWVRKFHEATNLQTYRWDKGGRLYSYPQNAACYQHHGETERLEMRIDGEGVVEIDISSSYLTIFYAWCDQQLDTDTDAYGGILGPTKVDRAVAKLYINVSFGNGRLLRRWTKDLTKTLKDRLKAKGVSPEAFDAKAYPMAVIKKRVLERHPILERLGGKIRGRVRDWSDLMFEESEIVIGAMRALMAMGVPSMPVHDSLIVPESKEGVAVEAIEQQFRAITGVVPKLDVGRPDLF
ncbi:hypothetical protein JQ633_08030 [Bradyrhizobium tropiciagri]|uniref:hypothetical protein n=1 Tax=Bradyrhizobium tropiciagri TaxID=312253 RepID=UPI001BABE4F7|nr:hypothetical protein [Bradyrhizobium tropiciagri]MBR0870300.1 hypothetical protein [Bradyrhizobium tropiciagri]